MLNKPTPDGAAPGSTNKPPLRHGLHFAMILDSHSFEKCRKKDRAIINSDKRGVNSCTRLRPKKKPLTKGVVYKHKFPGLIRYRTPQEYSLAD